MTVFRDGLKVATHLFEAAAWHYQVEVACTRCGRATVFDPHQLWWLFRRRHWDDRIDGAARRFACRDCRATGARAAATITLVEKPVVDHGLPFPPEGEWKKAVGRFRS